MTKAATRPSIGAIFYFLMAFTLGAYFMFAAVQGDYGVFKRVQIMAEADVLRAEVDRLTADLAEISNKTLRLSDSFLDLDLLDEQARDVLGYVRADEVVIR